MKKIIIVSVALAIFCSCSTYRYSARNVSIENHNISATPTVVDVEVDYTRRILETSRKCKTQVEAMQEAKYLAITNNKIDILVDMIYKIEKRGLKYIATVSGFAGHYKNSRSLYEDIKLLKDVGKEDVEKYLILHNPEVLQYVNQKGEVVNIYHNEISRMKNK